MENKEYLNPPAAVVASNCSLYSGAGVIDNPVGNDTFLLAAKARIGYKVVQNGVNIIKGK